MRPLWLPSRRLILPEQPRVQLLHQQQQRMNMAVACCCQPSGFACGEDLVECGQIVGATGSYFGDVKFWSSGAGNCANGSFVNTGEAYWDFVLDNFVFVPLLGDTWQVSPHPTNPGGSQYYQLVTPSTTRMAEVIQGDTGTLIGCMYRDGSTTEGYHFFRLVLQSGGESSRSVVIYWVKPTGTTKEGTYTYQPTLPTGWSAWPNGTPPSDLDVTCYTPSPTTIEIENC